MDPSASPAVALPPSIDPDLAAAAWRLVQAARRIAIFGHQHPDPDAIGSALGLAHALRPLGKECVVAVPDAPNPMYAAFLPGCAAVVTELAGPPFDLLIALDAGDLDRYGDLAPRHRDLLAAAPILNIDHHLTSAGCGVVNIIDPVAAASAELIALWLDQMGIAIGQDAAQCLLAGIITDTRAFEFTSTTARTMLVGAYLMARGAQPALVVKPMYRWREFGAARLFGLAAATLSRDLGGRLVWGEIPAAMWDAAGVAPGTQDDGISSFFIDVVGAQVAVLFRETAPGQVRVSVRTKVGYDATAVTTQFGGGGHARAGGCALTTDLATAKDQVLAAARALLA